MIPEHDPAAEWPYPIKEGDSSDTRPAASEALQVVIRALDPIDSIIVRRRILAAAAVYWGIDVKLNP